MHDYNLINDMQLLRFCHVLHFSTRTKINLNVFAAMI